MINFDAVDFSERRSEEVMFLLMLSVYIWQVQIKLTLQTCDISKHQFFLFTINFTCNECKVITNTVSIQ